ncbi:MAG TPA: PKD domain-containing protein [Solirubrobacterales bacterium]|jgi:PKD repeat protein|nr:PKD domain-containing protein [Solirubrobacterales bacterium]
MHHAVTSIGPRAAATLAAALVLLACVGAGSARADAAQVSVVSPGGAEQTLALDALAGSEDVVNRGYVLRSSGGETTVSVSGFSLAALIDAAGADPFSFSYLEVQRPGGGAVTLSRHQALDSGAFAEGPPVVYATPTGTAFLRPSAGAGDLNASDSFEAPQGVTVVLRKGTQLRVKAKASTVKAKTGQPVDFSAMVEGAGAGETLAYSWYFDDGHGAEAAAPTHSFAKRGSYDVTLGVTADGNATGASDVVTVQVGAPIAGPDRKGGGRNEKANAPDHGAAAGPSEGGSGTGGEGGTSEAVAAPVTAAPPVPEKSRFQINPRGKKGTTTSEGEAVSGELLTASTAPAPERQPQAEARSGSLHGGSGSGGGLPPAAWGTLATLGLLGAGALLEARGLGGLLPGRRGGLA